MTPTRMRMIDAHPTMYALFILGYASLTIVNSNNRSQLNQLRRLC